MLLARDASDALIRATPGAEATCPGCYAQVVPKCGEILTWHWAHRADALAACDRWTEPETEWHLAWKERALEFGCRIEVVIRDGGEWHRADIVRPDGVIVEVQHSRLEIGEAEDRDQFYRRHGGLVWLFDARDRWVRQLIARRYDDAGDISVASLVEYGLPLRDGEFVWPRPSEALLDLRAPMFWDVEGDGESLAGVRVAGLGWQAAFLSIRWSRLPAEVLQGTPAIPSEAWRLRPERCATCGAEPRGRFADGSPRFGCHLERPDLHKPIYMETA